MSAEDDDGDADGAAARDTRRRGSKQLPLKYLIAKFIRYYGHDAWLNPLYPTRDKIVPYGAFFVLLKMGNALETAELLQTSHGVAHAIGTAMSGSDNKHRSLTRKLIRTAYPEEVVRYG